MLKNVICLDFEASGLAATCYPIEVAIVNAETQKVNSWLIRPASEWLNYGLWTSSAEEMHGLSLDYVCAQGVPATEITAQITCACNNSQVLSDNPIYDNKWLNDLYHIAGVESPPIILEDFYTFVRHILSKNNSKLVFAEAKALAWMRFPIMHRAADDARRNAEILRYLSQYARNVNSNRHPGDY